MKRVIVVMALVGLAVSSAGCAGTSGSASKSDETKPAASQRAEQEPAGPTVIEATTPREKTALELAASDSGRKWAMGNSDGTMGSAKGEPFIIGYQLQFAGSKGIDSVVVLGGKVSRFFSKPGGEFAVKDAVISGSYDIGTVNYEKPSGAAQQAAFDAAKAYLSSNGYETAKGGIEGIVVSFPRVEEGNFAGQDPGVTVFARASLGDFASGGPSSRY